MVDNYYKGFTTDKRVQQIIKFIKPVALHDEEGHPLFVSIYPAVHWDLPPRITGDDPAGFCSTAALLVSRTDSLL